jgi:hypothetical protein
MEGSIAPAPDAGDMVGEHRIPGTLTTAAQKWLRHLAETYDWTPTMWELALLAADARDRAGKAQRAVNREGQTIKTPIVNRKGDVVAHRVVKHPAVDIARDAAATYSRLVGQLGLAQEEVA